MNRLLLPPPPPPTSANNLPIWGTRVYWVSCMYELYRPPNVYCLHRPSCMYCLCRLSCANCSGCDVLTAQADVLTVQAVVYYLYRMSCTNCTGCHIRKNCTGYVYSLLAAQFIVQSCANCTDRPWRIRCCQRSTLVAAGQRCYCGRVNSRVFYNTCSV